MDKVNKSLDNINSSINNTKENIAANINAAGNNITTNIMKNVPSGAEKYLTTSKEFLDSNTTIAKATFLFLAIIIFCILFYLFTRIIMYFMTPSGTPYLLDGMKDATTPLILPQDFNNNKSIQVLRSKNEYGGIEFTYSFWMFISDINRDEKIRDNKFMHVFHKGSALKNKNVQSDLESDMYSPNASPGVYLFFGKNRNLINYNNYTFNSNEESKADKYVLSKPEMNLLVRLNTYTGNTDATKQTTYNDIIIEGIPVKKWVNVIIRTTNQNIVDIYINGTLVKRHTLTNTIKQNYDKVYINQNGGFNGNLSNLRYYNYALGAFEIESIVSSGPNLKMAKNDHINKSSPFYLSRIWYNR